MQFNTQKRVYLIDRENNIVPVRSHTASPFACSAPEWDKRHFHIINLVKLEQTYIDIYNECDFLSLAKKFS